MDTTFSSNILFAKTRYCYVRGSIILQDETMKGTERLGMVTKENETKHLTNAKNSHVAVK